jgi:hypothetical protein
VSKLSTLRKLGVVARVAGQRAGRNRTLGAAMGAVRTTFRSFARAGHQLWLEVTGTVFLVMAVFGGVTGFHEYTKYAAGQATMGRVVIAACFTLTFAWFGLSSFMRARRNSQRS